MDLMNKLGWACHGCWSVLELGCGFGDKLAGINGPYRVGVDAHLPYIQEGRRRHPELELVHREAADYLQDCDMGQFDAVLLIDVLEHFTKPDALRLLEMAELVADKRVVLFIPIGVHPQTTDAYGMGGDHWQTHRSTWEYDELEALGFRVERWDHFHATPGKDSRAAFCVKETD